jgi:hypothetical protein
MKRSTDYLDRDALDSFYDKVREMASTDLGADCDGGVPIDIQIVDRSRYERSHYLHVPYSDKLATKEEAEDLLSCLMTNLSIASEALTQWQRMRKYGPRLEVVTATDKSLTQENRLLVEHNKQMSDELREIRQDVGAKIRRDSAVKDAREKRNQMTDALHHLWHCDIDECGECETHKKQQRLEGKRPDRKVRKETETHS